MAEIVKSPSRQALVRIAGGPQTGFMIDTAAAVTADTPARVPRQSRLPGSRRRLLLSVLAGAVFVLALLVFGLNGLIPFGLLLAFSTRSAADEAHRSVRLTRRNAGLAVATVAALTWFWLSHRLDLPESAIVVGAGALIALPLTLQESERGTARDHPVIVPKPTVTKRSVILGLWALVVFVDLYYELGQSFNVLAALCIVLPVILAASRARDARRGQLELGLLRHPLRPAQRGHLIQGVNIWVCCALLGGVVAAGGVHYARIGFSLNLAQFHFLIAVFTAGILLLAGLAVVPRRRVLVATNVVVALLSGFLALQLLQVSVPRTSAVVLDSPLAEEWFVLNGGRSVLLNGHSPNESNAIDFQLLGENGRTHTRGGRAQLADYPGFGQPVLAPADGRIVELVDGYADTTPGTNGDHANYLVEDIGGGRYVTMAHLQQGSGKVQIGDTVRRGQPLAAVGNSGHTNEPHLHLQVQDSPKGVDADHTYPVQFGNVEVTRGGPWPFGESGEVRTGDLVRPLGW